MGQYDRSNGGEMYLIEDEEQVASLEVRDPDNLAYVTQTTLSVDDTAIVIDALRKRFPIFRDLVRTISATPLRTAKTLSEIWQKKPMLF